MYRARCPECRGKIKVAESLYGRKVECKCGAVLRIPAAPDDGAPNPDDDIEFSCTACKTKLRVKTESAGKTAICNCGQRVKIPYPVVLFTRVIAKPFDEPFDELFADRDIHSAPAENKAAPSPDPLRVSPVYSNPYSAPPKNNHSNSTARGFLATGESEIQQVVVGQKLLLYALLFNISLYFCVILIGAILPALGIVVADVNKEATDVALIGILLLQAMMSIATWTMAIWGISKMGRIIVGTSWPLLIPAMFIPCISFVTIIVVNTMATAYLKQKGIKVGLLGAR